MASVAAMAGLTASPAVTEAASTSPLVPGFGTNGVVSGPTSPTTTPASALAVLPDGRILFGASDGDHSGSVRRYSVNGVLDVSFAPASETPGALNAGLRAGLQVDSAGRILAAGVSTDAPLLRFLPNGQTDASFSPPVGFPTRIAVLADDKVIVLESTFGAARVSRLLPTGQLDPTYNAGGSVPGSVDLAGIEATDLVLQDNGAVIVAGRSNHHGAALRLSPAGVVDAGFNATGALASSEIVWAVDLDASGRVLIATPAQGASSGQVLRRLLANGAVDPSFGDDGSVAVATGGSGVDLATDAEGRILLAGNTVGGDAALFRVLPDGSPDRSFSTGGVPMGQVQFDVGGEASSASQLIPRPDGTILVAGHLSLPLTSFEPTFRLFMAKVSASAPATTGAGFNPVAPSRALDTRLGIGAPATKTTPDQPIHLQVAGIAGVPTNGASAVTMNITVVGPDGPGYATVYPCDIPQPVVSNLNFAAGQDVPNLVTAPVAADGTICITTSQPAHLLADIAGWYGDIGAGFNPIAPNRVLDTRSGYGGATLVPGQQLVVRIAGSTGVPRDGASAVALNVTVTQAQGDGFVTVFPCNIDAPVVSNLNFVHGHDIANLVTVPLPDTFQGELTDGAVCVTASAPVDLLADVAGWFGVAGAGFNPVAPSRALDTRLGIGAPATKTTPDQPIHLQVAGIAGVPTNGASAVTMNITVVGPDGPGYATVYPCDIPQPVVSNLNFAAGQDVPNLVTAPVAADGTICITTSQPAHLLADIAGWYSQT